MKRSPLQRKTPLQRTGSLKRTALVRKPARRIAARVALKPYLGRVAQLPCAGELGIELAGRGWREHYCSGPIQVAHLGVKPGMGMKCPDDEVGPLCMGLHFAIDNSRGPFAGTTKDERRAWKDGVIARTRVSAGLGL